MCSVGQLALAQSRARTRTAVSSSLQEVSSAPRILDVGSAAAPTVATMTATSAVAQPVAGPPTYTVTYTVCCDSLLGGYAFQVYLIVTLAGPGLLSLTWVVSVLGSSFIGLWADERQLGRTRW